MTYKLLRKYKRLTLLLEGLLILLAFGILYNYYLPIGKEGKLVYFDVQDRQGVLQTLQENGYNITDWDLLLMPQHAIPKKGWYKITHTNEGRYHFFDQLNQNRVKSMKLRIYPGENSKELIQRLANDMKLDAKELKKYYQEHAQFKEANLLAGTYSIARDADANTTMAHLFSQTSHTIEKLKKIYHIDTLTPQTLHTLLTVASIVQKESNNPQEMPLIASVIYNRLGRNMKLQMDGTLNYGKYSHTIVTPERIKTDTSRYNTYKFKGLPPAPLASVSAQALEAVMFPESTNYLFFMLDKKGGHNFSATYEEHLTHLKAFKAYLKTRDSNRSSM